MRSSAPIVDPESYVEAHRYDGAAIQHQRRDRTLPCAIQPRDIAVLRDVWRYKFLTAHQLLELWWPNRSPRAGQRRLRKLFDAGHLDRFRPITHRGSYPWTYQLGEDGHRLLLRHGVIGPGQRYLHRSVYDYGYVLHEIQLNAWVLAYRRALGPLLLSWEGETHIQPPREARQPHMRLENDWSVKDLRDPIPRPVRPDAVLEIDRDDTEHGAHIFLIEYDRTRRVDKNYDKFVRYDAFLTWWSLHTPFAKRGEPPFVVFVCQDPRQREQFMATADHELTGHHWHASVDPDRYEYVGRRRLLFAIERDVHAGMLEAWRLPAFPPGHPDRTATVRHVRLPNNASSQAFPARADPR